MLKSSSFNAKDKRCNFVSSTDVCVPMCDVTPTHPICCQQLVVCAAHQTATAAGHFPILCLDSFQIRNQLYIR